MIDRREKILSRLVELMNEVPSIVEVFRNAETISAARRPAIVIHDAAESSADLSNRPSKSPNDMMTLAPQIFVLLGGKAEEVGSKIGPFRASIVPIIYNDSVLRELVGGASGSGDIHYTGCGLDTTQGENREARLEISFEFTYPFILKELTD